MYFIVSVDIRVYHGLKVRSYKFVFGIYYTYSLSLTKNAIVLQIDGPLFFASVENLMDIYVNSSIDSALIIDMKKITSMDLSGAFALDDIVKDAQSKNIDVYVINIANKVKEKLDRVNSLASLNKNNYL